MGEHRCSQYCSRSAAWHHLQLVARRRSQKVFWNILKHIFACSCVMLVYQFYSIIHKTNFGKDGNILKSSLPLQFFSSDPSAHWGEPLHRPEISMHLWFWQRKRSSLQINGHIRTTEYTVIPITISNNRLKMVCNMKHGFGY